MAARDDVRRKVHTVLRDRLGVSVQRVAREPEPRAAAPHRLIAEVDPTYHARYDEGLARSGIPESGRRRERFYNLLRLLDLTRDVDGLVGECGTWRGLSAFLLCGALADEQTGDQAGDQSGDQASDQRSHRPFTGEGVHLFDSFEGLSEPAAEDAVADEALREAVEAGQAEWDRFAATPEEVRATLSGFPDVALHRGWIPECFADAPEGRWRFVHVDVDLYEPIAASLEFFWPRMAPGGLVVCDDYGALAFPGAKQAVDEFAARVGCRCLSLSTGQAALFA